MVSSDLGQELDGLSSFLRMQKPIFGQAHSKASHEMGDSQNGRFRMENPI
jgi:hypothetical protein